MDRLAAGAFDEVILGADHQEPAGARVHAPGEFEDMGVHHIFRARQRLVFERPPRTNAKALLCDPQNCIGEVACAAAMAGRTPLRDSESKQHGQL